MKSSVVKYDFKPLFFEPVFHVFNNRFEFLYQPSTKMIILEKFCRIGIVVELVLIYHLTHIGRIF